MTNKPSITDFQSYSPFALRTLKPLGPGEQLIHAHLGLLTEVGEIGDNIKRHAIYGTGFNPINLMEEIGDYFWYFNLFLRCQGRPVSCVDTLMKAINPIASSAADTPENRPWALSDLTILLSGLTFSLSLSDEDRGATLDEMLPTLMAILARLLHATGHTLEQCLNHNIAKLALRYGDKYSDYCAVNRDTAAEALSLSGQAT